MTDATGNIEVIVVGCGVSGLTSGIRLLEKGFDVTILADKLPPNTTSNVAAAVWYPYRAYPIDRVLGWGSASAKEFYDLMDTTESGVRKTSLTEVFARPVPDPWWKGAVRKFHRVPPSSLPAGYEDGYSVEVPLIETPRYMRYLQDQFARRKGRIQSQKLSKLSDLSRDDRIIVNCAGVWARELVDDEQVYPIRGQIIRVKASGVEECLVDEAGPLALTYIVPRSQDYILGGTAEECKWDLEPDKETAEDILRRCKQLAPALVVEEVLEHLVGLRPGRKEVRLETERVSMRCAVIHNYGHGGAGFTLSWGCADEVAALAEDLAKQMNQRK